MTRASVRQLLLAATLAIGVAGASSLALAQDEPDPAEERAQSFEAAEGAQTENIPGGMLMVVAYGAILLLVLGYVGSLAMRQAKTQEELERLRGDLEAYGRDNPSGHAEEH